MSRTQRSQWKVAAALVALVAGSHGVPGRADQPLPANPAPSGVPTNPL